MECDVILYTMHIHTDPKCLTSDSRSWSPQRYIVFYRCLCSVKSRLVNIMLPLTSSVASTLRSHDVVLHAVEPVSTIVWSIWRVARPELGSWRARWAVGLETCHRPSTGNPSPFTPLGVGRTRLTRAGRMQKISLLCVAAIPLLKSPTVATFASPHGRVRSIAIKVSVCLSVRLNILKTTCKLHEILCTCCCGRHSVLWPQKRSIGMLCVSGYVHRESKRVPPYNHGYSFVNSWWICKILSLVQTAVNFQQI